MNCRICNEKTKEIFRARILNKYDIKYYYCTKCGSLQTEKPYWLEEAYKNPINYSDTGIVQRNIYLSKKIATILFFLFGKEGRYVDYAGGYGLFTRLMRDLGFDFYWYDPYTPNLMAMGFEYTRSNNDVMAVTTFESFEHFVNPLVELEKILEISKNVFFTTELLPNSIPTPKEWWYYGLEHGQHITFYSVKTLKYIAEKYKVKFLTNGRIHLLTEKTIDKFSYNYILKFSKVFFYFISKKLESKTLSDMNLIKNKYLKSM